MRAVSSDTVRTGGPCASLGASAAANSSGLTSASQRDAPHELNRAGAIPDRVGAVVAADHHPAAKTDLVQHCEQRGPVDFTASDGCFAPVAVLSANGVVHLALSDPGR